LPRRESFFGKSTDLTETVEATAVPVIIITAGSIFGFALTTSGFGFMVQDVLQEITASPTVLLMIVVAIFMVVGLFRRGHGCDADLRSDLYAAGPAV
jgi:TRAP-type C4-dicarboxylate transport system permease large subunit